MLNCKLVSIPDSRSIVATISLIIGAQILFIISNNLAMACRIVCQFHNRFENSKTDASIFILFCKCFLSLQLHATETERQQNGNSFFLSATVCNNTVLYCHIIINIISFIMIIMIKVPGKGRACIPEGFYQDKMIVIYQEIGFTIVTQP